MHGHFWDSKLWMCMELAPLGFALSHCCCSMSRGKLKTGLLKSWINRWSLIFIQYSINRRIFPRPFDFYFVISGKSYIFTQDYQIHPPPRWRSGRAFASHAGNRGLIPGQYRPKSLKQVGQLHCQTLGNRCECHGSSEMTIMKGCMTRSVSQ